MKIELDTDKLTVAQLYALSWLVFDQTDVYADVVREHNWRDKAERQEKRKAYEAHNE